MLIDLDRCVNDSAKGKAGEAGDKATQHPNQAREDESVADVDNRRNETA